MKKIFFVLFFVAFVLLLVIFSEAVVLKHAKPTARIGNQIFNIEIAKTQKAREKGLAKYNSIPQNFGMLFPFGKVGYYAFWMKDMKFPIDIIFIRNGKIIKIYKDVPAPNTPDSTLPIYKPDQVSDTVLEINSGLSDKYGFGEGDSVKISL